MKTILIEAVSNGWLVRPFSCCDSWAATDRPAIAVYTCLDDLCRELPELLGVAIRPPPPMEFVEAPKLDSDNPF